MLNFIVVHEYGDPSYGLDKDIYPVRSACHLTSGNEDDIRKVVSALDIDDEPEKGESIAITGFETAVCLAG